VSSSCKGRRLWRLRACVVKKGYASKSLLKQLLQVNIPSTPYVTVSPFYLPLSLTLLLLFPDNHVSRAKPCPSHLGKTQSLMNPSLATRRPAKKMYPITAFFLPHQFSPPSARLQLIPPLRYPADWLLVTLWGDDLPTSAERPRFVGPALAQEGLRQSYASSHGSFPGTLEMATPPSFLLTLPANAIPLSLVVMPLFPIKTTPTMLIFQGSGGMPLSSRGPSRYLEEKRDAYVPQRKSKRAVIIGLHRSRHPCRRHRRRCCDLLYCH